MPLLILGASARAAAQSARRAGLEPLAIDLFADRDAGDAIAVDPAGYPESLFAAAASAPPGPWLYTGGLENHPALIAALASRRPLLGNGPEALRVRDPIALQDALARAGLPTLDVRDPVAGRPHRGAWLVKPRRSAGGRAIVPLGPELPEPPGDCYLQERVEGTSVGALGLARDGGLACETIGLTAAWTGRPGSPFAYRGSLGPLDVAPAIRATVDRMLATIAHAFGLVGLFGVDLVVRPDAVPLAVEVNPRYSASVEVLELATGRALLAEHVTACDPSQRLTGSPPRAGRPAAVGKVIVFAAGPGQAPALDDWRPVDDPWEVPAIADVPRTGVAFEAGDPVLTLLEAAPTVADCRARLEARLAGWDERLRQPPWLARR